MTIEQQKAAYAMLANDEASTDAELLNHFMMEIGLTLKEAIQVVKDRNKYLKGINL